ncbi:MAG TPA: FHA domain-containing protein, partial [Bryobacteraceae bacterium]|nr:FHA domain-containing protein [Bryobacteraceae bacterium]
MGATPTGRNQAAARITGQIILDQLIRNMELGLFEMGYSVLVPCIFSVYLHPDEYARLAAVGDLIKEDARRTLTARLELWNSKASIFKLGGRTQKQYRIARKDWWIELFADCEDVVPIGDVEIHSELNEVPQPGYRGTKTTLIDRESSITEARVARDRTLTRRSPEKIFAEIRYEDDSGPQTYYVTQDEISIGRGGADLSVDLPLYTNDEVSREHLRLRRDPATGSFAIVDQSRNGTWVNGRRLARGVEENVPERAQILVAE